MTSITSPIPQPRAVPFLGNSLLIDQDVPLRSFLLLAQQYGEIFQLAMPGGRLMIHCTTYALVKQLSDDKRFKKPISRNLQQIKPLVGDGLFTAELEDPSWGIAHRILMPNFSTTNVRGMFGDMKDICSQMLLKWERFGPNHIFDPTDDFTRLTLDTIALFNSFYTPTTVPFVQAMFDILSEAGKRALRPAIVNSLPLINKATNEKFDRDAKLMTDTAREILEDRKTHPIDRKDLLALMLTAKDPKTGQMMSEDSIIKNLITFLVAGHETTSGMLSFTVYYLLRHPQAMQKLKNEIDEVCGDEDITLNHLAKMPYLLAVMRETLRLSPTAPLRTTIPLEEGTILIGGDGDPNNLSNKRYLIPHDAHVVVQSAVMMRDVSVWGEDANEFRPERMLPDENGEGGFDKLPPQAWQPFGFGLRACIGRPLSWQESQLVLAAVFQKFDIYFADTAYSLQIRQALTIKPTGMQVRVVPRRDVQAPSKAFVRAATQPNIAEASHGEEGTAALPGAKSAKTVHILYGSNTGTCEGLAQRLASDAASKGFSVTLATLDSATGSLPKETAGPVVVVTASFEGEPADNATRFFNWLQTLPKSAESGPLKGTSFAVFGCGNHEWAATYQRIPRLVDELLENAGAKRLYKRGDADVAAVEFFEEWGKWEEGLWLELGKHYDVSHAEALSEESESLQVEVVASGALRARLLRQSDAGMGRVLENWKLTREGAPVKRHIDIELPEGMSYQAGDYLAILPTNPAETVERVTKRLGLDVDSEVLLKSTVPTTFPTDVPVPILELLSGYVELSQPATTRDLHVLLSAATDSGTHATLNKLLENYHDLVLSKRISVLDILEDHPDLTISFASFLRLLPPMRVRQYSISSSPLVAPQRVSLTVSVVDAPALSNTSRRYLGVASNCLSKLKPQDRIPVVVRPSGAAFHLPTDPMIPIVMFCAGSGLAPFRGFIMERAAQKASGREVGKMLLFFGCRATGEDYLYVDGAGEDGCENALKQWVADGVVDLRPAFSRKCEDSEGCKYVQDRVLHEHAVIIEYFNAGAKFFTCGSRKAANGIRQACISIMKTAKNLSDDEAAARFEKVQKERYATDIFD